MKLIDRDLLLQTIEESREKNPHEDSKIRVNHTIEHDHIAHLVLEQPTAYDVNKVVEKIADYYDLVPGWALKEIIEIVKSCGSK